MTSRERGTERDVLLAQWLTASIPLLQKTTTTKNLNLSWSAGLSWFPSLALAVHWQTILNQLRPANQCSSAGTGNLFMNYYTTYGYFY